MKTRKTCPASQKQIFRLERIGQTIRVLKEACKDAAVLQGTVVDETKNTFLVQTKAGKKRVPKKNTRFCFPCGVLDGNDILVAPSERLKR